MIVASTSLIFVILMLDRGARAAGPRPADRGRAAGRLQPVRALLFTGMRRSTSRWSRPRSARAHRVLFIAAILLTTRRSTPRRAIPPRAFVLVLIGFLALMLFASTGLPDRGDPDAPAHRVSPPTSGSLADTETPNVVTALLADYRSQDTLGETLVILTAALAAALVLMRRPTRRRSRGRRRGRTAPLGPPDRGRCDHDRRLPQRGRPRRLRAAQPVHRAVRLYIIAHGHYGPGRRLRRRGVPRRRRDPAAPHPRRGARLPAGAPLVGPIAGGVGMLLFLVVAATVPRC
jgi:hypothetical protein